MSHPLPPQPLAHGGRLEEAARRFGSPVESWLDLSTGINPRPYPLPDVPARAWNRLPEDGEIEALCRAAADHYGVSDPSLVVPAPGSQALIQWLPRLLDPGRVAVATPTYGEHAPRWRDAGHRVAEVPAEALGGTEADAVVVVNPNNPDGRVWPGETLSSLSAERLVIVDEAFADPDPSISIAGEIGRRPGLVALRSFGKFFGLAGLRLGFALAEPALAVKLRNAMGAWAVSGPAITIATRALKDRGWIEETRTRLASDAGRLDRSAAAAGLTRVGGTPLFGLYAHDHAPALFEHLGRRAILVRAFPDMPSWLRIGLPGTQAEEERLAEALESWRAGR